MSKFKKFHIDILFDTAIQIQILPIAPIMAFTVGFFFFCFLIQDTNQDHRLLRLFGVIYCGTNLQLLAVFHDTDIFEEYSQLLCRMAFSLYLSDISLELDPSY